MKFWDDPTRSVRLVSILILLAVLVVVILGGFNAETGAFVAVALALIAVMWAVEQTVQSRRLSDEAGGREERMVELLASIDSRLERIEAAQQRRNDD